MKLCPKCSIHHEKSGIFCSYSCSNSRGPRTKEFKEKVSSKLKGVNLSSEHKEKIRLSWYRGQNREPINLLNVSCSFCNLPLIRKKKSKTETYFCSGECRSKFNEITKSRMALYRSQCRFEFNVFDFPDKFDLSLIERFGWYSPTNKKNNLTGVSRDHKFSVKDGFLGDVSPKIISHPANCELMIHSINNKKNSQSSISLKDLMSEIENWRT